MKNELYELYQECFPTLKMKKESFLHRIDYDNSEIIMEHENSHMVGAAVINENSILLMCVNPRMQKKGYGKKLLHRSEKLIQKKQYNQIILGCGRNYLFPGVPMKEVESSKSFFERFGYHADWECVDMELSLKDFNLKTIKIPPLLANMQFGFVDKSRRNELLDLVRSVDENWVRYYQNNLDSAYVAILDGKIVGFQLVDWSDPINIVNVTDIYGTVGCVGVKKQERGQGIGINMVANGMMELKLRGCTKVFIGFTHLENWYSQLGSKTIQRYWMGAKNIV